MTADASRRPRSPRAQDKGTGSPAVSELSADGSGTLRSVDDTTLSPPGPTVRARSRGVNSLSGVGDRGISVRAGSGGLSARVLSSDEGVEIYERDERNGEASDVSSSLSTSSSVVHSHSDFDSDVEDNRSGSETYWGDLGGEVERDEIGWTEVIKQHDIQRTYDSDKEDGGAFTEVRNPEDLNDVDVEDLEVVVGMDKTKEITNMDTAVDDLDKELDELELLEDDDDRKDALSIDSVKILDAHDVVSHSRTHSRSISDSSLRAPPSDDSLDDDIDAVAVALSDGDELLPDDDSLHSDSGNSTDGKSVGFILPSNHRDYISSAESDDAVAVALSDGEEVLGDESEDEPVEPIVASPRRRVVDVGTPRRARARVPSTACSRLNEIMTRLTSIRAGLQLVQMELATRSAANQHECGKKNKNESSELKIRLRKERVELSATLNHLAKKLLERAIDLESKLERELESGNKPCGIL